jgi:hypothetical protein
VSDTSFRMGGGPRLRLGGGLAADPDAIARAEAALKSLSANFETWMADELKKLLAARAAIGQSGLVGETGEELYRRAHDLKGLGATYEYPIVTRLAASLCRLTHDAMRRASVPMPLVDDHIEAVRHAVEGQIKTEDDPWAASAASDLEARTNQVLAA